MAVGVTVGVPVGVAVGVPVGVGDAQTIGHSRVYVQPGLS